MGPLAVGEVVLVPFPFSDLSDAKLRPALLLAHAGRQDWLCLQITSRSYADAFAIFTAHKDLFRGVAGQIGVDKLEQTRNRLIELIQTGGWN